MIISKVDNQEVRRTIQRQCKIHESKCFASAVIRLEKVDTKQVYIADDIHFDRNKQYPLYLTGADVFEVDYGRKHTVKGEAVAIDHDGKHTVFFPPVLEKYGPYLILVAGLYAYYGQIDEGETPYVLIVDSVSRELPPHPYIPEMMPKHSYDFQFIMLTRRNHGESRHFISAY